MRFPRDLRFQRALFWFVVFSATAVVGFLVFMFSGIYNVAASVQHFDVTDRVIKIVLGRSIRAHSDDGEGPDLADPGLVRLGANHYAIGCAPCHGSPAARAWAVVDRMYPAPPPLSRARDDWSAGDLHWIVRNGLKFTGMPAWPGEGRSEEVWPLVAFLEAMPAMDARAYQALVAPPAFESAVPVREPGSGDAARRPLSAVIAGCAACHGVGGAAPVHGLVPVLAGQKSAYLDRALREFRDDARQSGMMEPVAHDLDDATIAALAANYAASALPADAGSAPPAVGDAARGRVIALKGVPRAGVAPCAACHAARRSAQFPRLDGLSATYVATQLRLFREGVRGSSAYAEIMEGVARRLDDAMIGDVAAYLASDRAASAGAPGEEPSP